MQLIDSQVHMDSLFSSDLEAVAEEIRGLDRHALPVKADITQKAAVDNLVQRAVDEFGAIDILVNNAGTIVRASLLEHSEEDWARFLIPTSRAATFALGQRAR